jgi:hypothetical protein
MAHLVTSGERRVPGALLASYPELVLQRLAALVIHDEAVFGLFDGYASWDGAEPPNYRPSVPWALLWGATGLGVLCLRWAMLRSVLFPRVLAGLGLLGGVLMTVDGVAFGAPEYASAQAALQAAGFVMWIWMIWSGVLMWRASPRA